VETLFVAVVDAEKNPLMLLPLGIQRRHGVRVLTFLDGGLSDYNSPVVFPATRDWGPEDVRMVWRELQANLPFFDVAILDKMPERVGDLPNPLILLGETRHTVSGHATTLSGTWSHFKAERLPRRRMVGNHRRRLLGRGRLTFEIAKTSQQRDAFLAALIRQKIRLHRETRTSAEFDQPGYREFVTEMTNRPSTAGIIHLSALKVEDTIVAVHWGYVVGSRFYALISAYEGGAWARFSPGRLLYEHFFEWSFAQGIEIFDFGIGDEDYKLEYCDVEIALHLLDIPVTLRGAEYSVALKITKMLRRKVSNTRVGSVLKYLLRKGPEHNHVAAAPETHK
jgi:CelD/BcsL family acetyltransferase involved in cellulose biosynthesis